MSAGNLLLAVPAWRQTLMAAGLDAAAVFERPDIHVWRKLRDRENCTLDLSLEGGRTARLHLKRYARVRTPLTPADFEAQGIRLLTQHQIPTAPLVAWGRMADGRSFIIIEDLDQFQAADKLLAAGVPFERLLKPTADLAARLHHEGLHHRDLYLCHFFAKVDASVDLRLIDAARVRQLPRWLRRRWIVKDLAQFWYSTLNLKITEAQRSQWLEHYARQRGDSTLVGQLRSRIERKAAWIARHDKALRRRQPGRNISIPTNDRPH